MLRTAGIVLAGGRSSRMGTSKAALDWHGSTLLRRVTGIVARAVEGPVVVVRAPGQPLPPLPPGVELAQDAVPAGGPLQAVAAGLAAIGDRAELAYASSTDVPLLHPAFVARVTGALAAGVDVVLPDLDGHLQPLAAAYRVALLPLVQGLIAAGEMKPARLFERVRVLRMPAEELLRDRTLAAADPALASVSNLNEPADYERALASPGPEVSVALAPIPASKPAPEPILVRAWSLGAAAAAVGVGLVDGIEASLNGCRAELDPELPLVAGDRIDLDNSCQIQ